MLMMICVCFFLFWFWANLKKSSRNWCFRMGPDGLEKEGATFGLQPPTSIKTKIRKSDWRTIFLLHVTIFIFNIWSNHLDKCICITSCQWSFWTHDLCAPSSLSDLAAPAAVLFRDLARWKKAYVLQGIVKDQQWEKKPNWEETRVYHACIV